MDRVCKLVLQTVFFFFFNLKFGFLKWIGLISVHYAVCDLSIASYFRGKYHSLIGNCSPTSSQGKAVPNPHQLIVAVMCLGRKFYKLAELYFLNSNTSSYAGFFFFCSFTCMLLSKAKLGQSSANCFWETDGRTRISVDWSFWMLMSLKVGGRRNRKAGISKLITKQ